MRFFALAPALGLASLVVAGSVLAATGQIDFASGEVRLVGADGKERPAIKGADLNAGDTLSTRDGSLAQLRFPDGTVLSVQANTLLGIQGVPGSLAAGAGAKGIFSLGFGTTRIVLANIIAEGSTGPQVLTPSGTVSVGGSGIVQTQSDGSTLVISSSGTWRLANSGGTMTLTPGQPAQTPAPAIAPSPATTPPSAPPPPPTLGPLTSGSGVATSTLPATGYVIFPDAVGGAFDTSGHPTTLSVNGSRTYARQPGSERIDSGGDGIIAWGRWIGPVSLIDSQGFVEEHTAPVHYVVGTPTAALPVSGSATYSLLGATSAIGTGGQLGSFSGSMAVDFGAASAAIRLNFQVAMPYGAYAANGSGTATSSRFDMGLNVTGTGSACLLRCGGLASGFFAGTSAERAGIVYQFTDLDTPGTAQVPTVQGVAAFKRN